MKSQSKKLALVPLTPAKIRDAEPFSVADIEARKWIKFIVIGHFDGKVFRYFTKLREFFLYVIRHPHKLIFCHYGGVYDFQFLLEEILRTEIEGGDLTYSVENLIPRGSGILCFDFVLYSEGDEIRRIRFSDSGALLPHSLESLTNDFNVQHKKLTETVDYNRFKTASKKLVKYLEHDCRGLHEVLNVFFSWPLVKNSGSAITTAGQSMRIFRTFLREPLYSLDKEVDEFVRSGYLGGRVEVFKPLFQSKTKPLFQYDVNSIYPFVMRENNFPGEVLHDVDYFNPREMQMLRAKVWVPRNTFIPFLGTRFKGKLIFPVGTFKGVWTSIELEYAKSLGAKILKVYEGYSFKNRGPLFKDFINSLWQIRRNSDSGSVDNQLAKLLMNANYGRHGLITQRENLVFDEFTENLEEYLEIKAGKNTVQVSKKKVDLQTYSNVIISAWVTAHSRILMHKWFKKLDWDVYYSDTDSFFTSKKIETSQELGGLKLEDTIKSACFLLPKTYCYELWKPKKNKKGKIIRKKVVMKGFDKKKIQRFKFEDFRLGLAGDLRRLRVKVAPRFARFRTAMRQGGLLYLTEKSTRQVKSLYDKRRIVREGEEWTTKPLVLRVIKTEKKSVKKRIQKGKQTNHSFGGRANFRRKVP